MEHKIISRVKGTQDLLDLRLFNYFLKITKEHLENYNFKEISTPIIEHAELFLRTLGTETDVVTKQMYMLQTHEAHDSNLSESEKICLRPEATASIMRAYLEAHITQVPWKVFTYGPMFRYERPQKGRYRQFHQLSMEIINAPQVSQDAFFIASLDRLFSQRLMLDNYALLINFLGCSQDRVKFKFKLAEFIADKVICDTCNIRKEKNLLRIFDCKK